MHYSSSSESLFNIITIIFLFLFLLFNLVNLSEIINIFLKPFLTSDIIIKFASYYNYSYSY